jgi:WD40 repeat protein
VYHVFLSHSSADKSSVEQLALRLRDQTGLNPFLDKWHLVPGASWQPALEQALADSETVAVFFGPSDGGPWRNEELQLALVRAAQQRNDFRVIPVLLPGANPEQLGGFLGLRTWVDFREGLDSEAAFARLVAGIQGRAPSGDTFTLPDEPAPYRGLLAFDEAHSEYFFGRDADIGRTLEKLGRERFVAVVGASGCGKSSLVLGGVLPQVKQNDGILGPGVRAWTMRPGDRPLRALSDALAAGETSGAQRLALSDALHRRFLEHPDGLRTTVATLTTDSPGPCILVVDQLEELFTHAPEHGGAGEAAPFAANLRTAAQEGSGTLRILATLRADFFDRCLSLAPLRELLQDRTVLLGSLGEEALRDVILRPAQKVGAYLEKGLLSAILQDVSREPGALPLLEDALDQLWRARRGAWLTLSAYEASGGISQALHRRAQVCYEALPPEEREVARLLLVRLTSLGEGREDTRRRVPRSELVFPGIPEARVEHVLRVLSGPGARLIVVDQGSVEVAHEVLIRTWPTLRKWLDEDRRELRVQRRLAEAAGEWNEKGRQADYLYTGARMLDAEELFTRKPSLVNQLEREFLEASSQLRDQRQREAEQNARRELEAARQLADEMEARRKVEAAGAAKARRSASQLRMLALGLVAAIVAVAAGAVLLYRQSQRSLSRELVLSARQSLSENSQRSLLLLQEAQHLAPVDNLGEHLDVWSQEPNLFVLRGHGSSVTGATFSPDGASVLTASGDGTARLWSASSGRPLATFQEGSDDVRSASFSPEGSLVVTVSDDGTARVWEASSGKRLARLSVPSTSVWSATFTRDGSRVVTAFLDGTARMWQASSGKLLATLLDPSKGSLTVSPDGSRALTSNDGMARVWDVPSGKLIATLQLATFLGDIKALPSATLSPDGSRVIASSGNTAWLWDVSSGKAPVKLQCHSGPIRSETFSHDGSRAVTTSNDGTACVWDASSGTRVATLSGHSGPVVSAAFSSDGSHVVTASYDAAARVWEVSSSKSVATFLGHSSAVWSAAFSPDGSRIVTAALDDTARVWEVSSGKPVATLRGLSKAVEFAAVSPDGSRVLTSDKGTVRLWETSTGEPVAIREDLSEPVLSAAFGSGAARVLTASEDGTARVWEVSSDQPPALLQGHSKAVESASFSSDGERVLTTSEDGTARVWQAASGTLLATRQVLSPGFSDKQGIPDTIVSAALSQRGARVLTVSQGETRVWDVFSSEPPVTLEVPFTAVWSATFSPDGSRVLTVTLESVMSVWDVSSGRLLATLPRDSGMPVSVVFSPDSSRVLITSEGGTARIWEASSGTLLATFKGHSDNVLSTAFSPDGSRVITASLDGRARVWEASSGKPLALLQSQRKPMRLAAFSPDGSLALTVSDDGTHVWPSWRWDPEAFKRLEVGRPLTCEERRTFLHENSTCTGEPASTAMAR